MKTKLFILLVPFFISCSPITFYQVYNTKYEEAKIYNDSIVFEDQNCKLLYSFWDEGGNAGFRFINKSDKNIFIDLSKSFFILNGTAYDYYQNRIFSSSSKKTSVSSTGFSLNYLSLFSTNSALQAISPTVSSSSKSTTTDENSVSFIENKLVCIPPKASKNIAEYYINNTLYRDCDLLKHPNKKQIKSISFSKNNSPFVFSNIIAYYLENENKDIFLRNDFWVSDITNLPKSEFEEYTYDEFCGQKTQKMIHIPKNPSPTKFYIMYKKSADNLKH